ncbi:MAG: hypothetical protein EOO87_00595 [Pedobacter sp.]|nr:MAG: hypothetical protein EOO87_00595 [Pedobacter sp.]
MQFFLARKPNSILTILMLMVCLSACKNSSSTSGQPQKYSLHILDMSGKEYILATDDLDSGSINPEDATEVLPDSVSRDIIVKCGFYYHLARKSDVFTKYNLHDKKLTAVSKLQLKDFDLENFSWVGKDSLLLSGLNHDFNAGKYYLINTKSMSIIGSGLLGIEKPKGKFITTSIGFVKKRSDTIFVGYTFHPPMRNGTFTTSDTIYVSRLAYPSMKSIGIEKETRSTYPAGVNNVQTNEFTDEKGDFYFMSCPGIAMGNRPELPTAIFRIKSQGAQIDKNYLFNISSLVGNHAYGLWYLGNGKAIVRSERKDLFKGLADHYSTPHFEFYLLDIDKQKVIKKLDLPLDKGTRKDCVIVNGDMVYIAVNSETDGNYIWNYNLKTDKLTKGLRLGGVTAFIVRLDKLVD